MRRPFLPKINDIVIFRYSCECDTYNADGSSRSRRTFINNEPWVILKAYDIPNMKMQLLEISHQETKETVCVYEDAVTLCR